ncbi:MAG: cytochrome c oxidase accessory protein CcoG [Thiotrichales bacterium]|jgi:cytochrome c oxidase accessory protein FixG|nr:cytochrome c oxidase accessory protein CcoG [Thiotrichales bacterium]MBT3613803.1 cytochrome c oxidase accessory protein CcoG [Thiotrichales bacterium]MBT3753243.1 cytochrome c oxidase accessory protein CcoG [Thiotrichales bacterium]MBT3837852.1 cytochrome c oxidase accessory protein CcoG [Thiotrichales bacterium]MBT4152095.1 cytochrome c oxidase accessory protein CcoG [Thiotrichales bacterium]
MKNSEKSEESETQDSPVDHLYEDISEWKINTGEETIHAKRMGGKFRTIKWLAASSWFLFFFAPYLRWNGSQAILFDIPGRQYHIFNLTILPQDVWMLSLVLLFFAIMLAVVTTMFGRVYCGFFCFQTIWVDAFTWIEEKLEGAPAKRRKLDKAKFSGAKLWIKTQKHFWWTLISLFTGLTFVAWFTDVFQLWQDYFTLSASSTEWGVLALFTVGTYVLAGFMREQACLWLCPYARIQAVMIDRETLLPTYDFNRGEPRGRLKKGETVDGNGDCIDCNQCVAVCPTGVDIRGGLDEGCITCALCIDACDSVMEKIDKPVGLIRYESIDALEGKYVAPLFKRPRVLVYLVIMTLAFGGIVYGLMNISGLDVKVLHERQPLFVLLSNGSIQNKYELKILNKTHDEMRVVVTTEGLDGAELVGAEKAFAVRPGRVTPYTVYVRYPRYDMDESSKSIIFKLQSVENKELNTSYKSMFLGPR